MRFKLKTIVLCVRACLIQGDNPKQLTDPDNRMTMAGCTVDQVKKMQERTAQK